MTHKTSCPCCHGMHRGKEEDAYRLGTMKQMMQELENQTSKQAQLHAYNKIMKHVRSKRGLPIPFVEGSSPSCQLELDFSNRNEEVIKHVAYMRKTKGVMTQSLLNDEIFVKLAHQKMGDDFLCQIYDGDTQKLPFFVSDDFSRRISTRNE